MERRMNKAKMLLAILLSALSVFAITACNTLEGAGRDIQRGGEEIEDAAK